LAGWLDLGQARDLSLMPRAIDPAFPHPFSRGDCVRRLLPICQGRLALHAL